jgi:hypothetical protein
LVLRTTDLMIDTLITCADKESPACPKKSNCPQQSKCANNTLCPGRSHTMSTCDNSSQDADPNCLQCGDNTTSELRELRDELRRTLEAELVGA